MPLTARILVTAGALCGAAGVAAAASASHLDSRNLNAIAMICLSHGPTLLALGLHGRGRVMMASGAVLALGTALFGSDLMMRELLDQALFPGAAPIGGGLMILGWLGIALGAWAKMARKN